MVTLFLADGFEEIEALATVDVLRRAEIKTWIVSLSLSGKLEVTGAHGINVIADTLFNAELIEDSSVLVLPGGMPGTTNLMAHAGLKNALIESHNKGKWIAAICAAPRIIGALGFLDGKEAVCYPGNEEYLKGATLSHEPVVVSGNIITAKGAGVAIPFALKIVEILKGEAAAQIVAKKMIFQSEKSVN